jgi:hypothetical protein
MLTAPPYAAHSGFRGQWPEGFVLEAFSIQTIIEGSDAVVESGKLIAGKVTTEEVDEFIKHMEDEASRLWQEANGEDA